MSHLITCHLIHDDIMPAHALNFSGIEMVLICVLAMYFEELNSVLRVKADLIQQIKDSYPTPKQN